MIVIHRGVQCTRGILTCFWVVEQKVSQSNVFAGMHRDEETSGAMNH